ncbi:putative clathrin assembly protein [Hordeum vulgare]|nr:putative clathrin assembly protein [Hordeum vulgare]
MSGSSPSSRARRDRNKATLRRRLPTAQSISHHTSAMHVLGKDRHIHFWRLVQLRSSRTSSTSTMEKGASITWLLRSQVALGSARRWERLPRGMGRLAGSLEEERDLELPESGRWSDNGTDARLVHRRLMYPNWAMGRKATGFGRLLRISEALGLLREGDPTFREELLNFTQRGHILQLSNFKDDSSPIAWDCSAWVRTYGQFLEERLECFRILKYDVEAERLSKQGQDPEKGHSRTRDLDSQDLLEQLPALQQLLYRLVGCRPEGAANNNYLVQYALALAVVFLPHSMGRTCVYIHHVDKDAFLKGNIDPDPDELDMVFDLCPSYAELLEQVRKDLNWMDPSDVVEFAGRHNVGFRMHIRWKTMRVNSEQRWLAYKDTVAESLDKALELFAMKTNVPNLLDLNRVSSSIVEAIPATINEEASIEPLSCVYEANEEVNIEHEPLVEANYEHYDDGNVLHDNNLGDLDKYNLQETMDHSIPYSRGYASESDDEGPDEEVDEEGFTAKEAEAFTKVWRLRLRRHTCENLLELNMKSNF